MEDVIWLVLIAILILSFVGRRRRYKDFDRYL